MKIGLVCPYDWDAPGGVQVHIHDQAQHFLALGHDVNVLAPSESDEGHPSWFTSGGPSRAVRYNGSVARLAFGLGPTRRVRQWVREHDFDVLHVHEPLSPSLSLLAVWSATGPIVGTFHSSMERSRVLTAGNAMAQTVLEKLRGRIAVSESARRTFVDHVGGNFVVIPNGISVANFAGGDVLPGHPRPHSLLFLGRINESRKGLHVLMAALPKVAQIVPDVSLLVAGPGDSELALAQLPPEHRHRVEFLGFIAAEQKAATLRSAWVYVAPNTGGESFGIILTEAMAAGAPIVASDLPAFAAVLDHAAGAMFRNEDAEDLARVLVEVLTDDSIRTALQRKGRERVQVFDWDRVTQDILDVYASVMTGDVGVREDLRGQIAGRLARSWGQ
ncbi:MAG: glycosyltransferase family 4 protein [Candidatus Nanopelagicales bacterium]